MSDKRVTSVQGFYDEQGKFFKKFIPLFESFAEKHNLMIKKYWYDWASWRFNFKHPKGGVACIEVMREDGDMIGIYGYWWLDIYDEGTRLCNRMLPSEFF